MGHVLYSTLIFSDRVSYSTGSMQFGLHCPASMMILGSDCLCSPTLVLQACKAKSGFFMWMLEI